MNSRRLNRIIVPCAWSGLALWTTLPALAQQDSPDVRMIGRIIVTGSNIKRADAETAAPIQVLTREDIESSGLNTIADVLHTITANSNATISEAFTAGFAAGASGVSLRGLGANNTLVLMNGRRLASYGFADDGQRSFVDLNQIPIDAVERIEILKDGASAIYGSDAVAGVVNIILRNTFTGISVNAQAGMTSRHDGKEYRGAVTAGLGDLARDRYNVFLTIDAMKQDSVPTPNRASYVGTSDLTALGLPDRRPGNPLSGYFPFNPAGVLQPMNPATGETGENFTQLPGCRGPLDAQGFCRWDVKQFVQIQPQTERFNVFGRGTLDIGGTIQGYAELSYFRSKLEAALTPQSTPPFAWWDQRDQRLNGITPLSLPIGHPDNIFAPDNMAALPYYTMADVGGRNESFETDTRRFLLGAKGTTGDWEWDIGALYIQASTNRKLSGFIQYDHLQQALNGQGGYGYYRIGQNAALNNPGMYGFLSPTLTDETTSKNMSIDARASRDVMKLDGGPLALAVGAEFRREKLDNPGLPGTYDGNVMEFGYSAANGSRDVGAIYAELYAPALKNLEFSVAARADHYSDYGTSVTPKLGAKWAVVPQAVLRGTYAGGFRAPGPYENGKSSVASFSGFVDPVRCPVTGSPADCGQWFIAAITQGNPEVQPEKSKSWTVGAILEPARGLSATLDYWNIEIRQQIVQTAPQSVLNDPAAFPGYQIVRDSNDLPGIANSGSVLAVYGRYVNANLTRTDGIDLDARYRWNLDGYGRFATELQWTHIFNWKRTLSNGESSNYAGTHGPTEIGSSAGMPRDKINVIAGWDRGSWNVTGTVRYVGPMQNIESQQATGCLWAETLPSCRIASFTTLDLYAAYKGFPNWTIYGSVINVFNRLAPMDPQAGYGFYWYNFNYAMSGALGTQFNLGARYSFW